ncbi:P-loop containing nucleoside triphosphate hydrolase protein [Baffinella frigidus]|nr:P-loop containing nucleoside triphosphate hydrolase protein [Cryptophyta sp. CCMP2293]
MIPLSFKGLVDNLSLLGGGQTLVASSSTTAVNMALQFMIMFVGWKLLQVRPSTLSDVLRQYAWVRVASDLRRRTSETLLAHLHSLSMRFHVTSKSGEVLQIIDKGTTGIERLMEVLPFRLFPALVDVVLVCLVLLSQGQPVIASITGAVCPPPFFTSFSLDSSHAIIKWECSSSTFVPRVDLHHIGRAVESLQNFETVKYFASDKHELRQFSGMVKEWQGRQLTSERSLAILNVAQKIIVCVGLASALYVATGSVAAGTMTVGGLVMTATYMEQLHVPLSWLGTIYRMVEDSYVDMERMFSLLDRKPEVADLEGAQVCLVVAKGLVEFVNVSFSYESSRSVLNGVSFRVEPGKTLALVGESGGGKSTIGRLLFRLYDVTSGSVLIDGVDIRNVTQASVRSSIGVVPQETTLFNSELGYNIRYGGVSGEELPSNQEDVEKAARSAMLHERVLTFEDGYATIVGEKGLRLSGGERQRVGIARTLIKEPRIMLLDEATSALDTQTETQIQAALAQATKGRTAIVIAHRLSTVVDADEIAVMRGGKIVERGRHEDLLARSPPSPPTLSSQPLLPLISPSPPTLSSHPLLPPSPPSHLTLSSHPLLTPSPHTLPALPHPSLPHRLVVCHVCSSPPVLPARVSPPSGHTPHVSAVTLHRHVPLYHVHATVCRTFTQSCADCLAADTRQCEIQWLLEGKVTPF